MQEEHSLIFKVDHLVKFRELLSDGTVKREIERTKATIEKEIIEVSKNCFTITVGINNDTDIEEMMVCLHPFETGFDLLRPPVIRDLENERMLEEALAA